MELGNAWHFEAPVFEFGANDMKSILIAGLVLGACIDGGQAVAQTDMVAMAHNMSANELGILEYCHTEGYIDGTGAAAQTEVMARMPAYAGSTAAAEATGKSGMFTSPSGTVSLADIAAKGNSTQAALCQQMAENVKKVAASQQSSFGAGGMPAVPGGMPQMPAMPGGMPQMPNGAPAMPPGEAPH